jgi:hypothetical protein
LNHAHATHEKLKKSWVLMKVTSTLYEAHLNLKRSVRMDKDEFGQFGQLSLDDWIETSKFQSDLNDTLLGYGLTVNVSVSGGKYSQNMSVSGGKYSPCPQGGILFHINPSI